MVLDNYPSHPKDLVKQGNFPCMACDLCSSRWKARFTLDNKEETLHFTYCHPSDLAYSKTKQNSFGVSTEKDCTSGHYDFIFIIIILLELQSWRGFYGSLSPATIKEAQQGIKLNFIYQ